MSIPIYCAKPVMTIVLMMPVMLALGVFVLVGLNFFVTLREAVEKF